MRTPTENRQPPALNKLEYWIFFSRWLQAPMYFGLIVAQMVYVYKFGVELLHLITGANAMKEVDVLLMVLGLVDVVMIANLLLMVIVGGYETFVSRLYIDNHPDKPEWIDHVDAGVLKIKLAASLITISSIHLLKTFISADTMKPETIAAQVGIHCVFLISALALAWTEKIMKSSKTGH
jgi:uncharacterized protein (TIGR00645 family)